MRFNEFMEAVARTQKSSQALLLRSSEFHGDHRRSCLRMLDLAQLTRLHTQDLPNMPFCHAAAIWERKSQLRPPSYLPAEKLQVRTCIPHACKRIDR